MFAFLRRLFHREREVGNSTVSIMDDAKEQVVQAIVRAIQVQIRNVGLDPNLLSHHQSVALCGYIRGITDISAQRRFAAEPAAPMLLFVKVYEGLLAQADPSFLVSQCQDHIRFQNPIFIVAAQAGAADAERFAESSNFHGLSPILQKLK